MRQMVKMAARMSRTQASLAVLMLVCAVGFAQEPNDASALESPVTASPASVSLPVGSGVSVRLVEAVDSGTNKNGDAVQGVLSAPVKTTKGTTLPSGTEVMGTVVSSAKAGELQSAGEISLQLTRVGNAPVITDVLDFNGREGHKDVADSAPAKGTEAMVPAEAVLQFKVMESGRATGLDLEGAEKARQEGTVGGGPGGGAGGVQGASGTPSTGPGASQTAAPGTTTPH